MLKRKVKLFYKLQIPCIRKQLMRSKLSKARYPKDIIAGNYLFFLKLQNELIPVSEILHIPINEPA